MTHVFVATDTLMEHAFTRVPDITGMPGAYCTGFHDGLAFAAFLLEGAMDFLAALNQEAPAEFTFKRREAERLYRAFKAATTEVKA